MKVFDFVLDTFKAEKADILFGASIASGAIALVTACIASVKSAKDISETAERVDEIKNSVAPEKEDPEEFEIAKKKEIRKEVVWCGIRTAKRYIEPVSYYGISIATAFRSISTLKTTCSMLGIGYSALDKRFKFLERNVINNYGEDEYNRMMYGYKEEEINIVEEDDNGNIIEVKKKAKVMDNESNPYAFMYTKGTSKNWRPNNNYNMSYIDGILKHWNNVLQSGTYEKPVVVLLNDILVDLEMERTPEGAITGWVTGRGDGYITGRLVDVYKESIHNGANPRDLIPSVAMNFNCLVDVHKYIGKDL